MSNLSKRREDSKARLVAVTLMILRGKKMTAGDIMRELDLRHDIQVDRKTIYSDIAAIDKLIPVEVTSGKHGGYQRMRF